MYFSSTLKFMLEHTKLTKNESLWIFLIANDASLGIFGFSSIILRAISLIDSIVAPNSLLFFSGFNSGISLIFAVIYGSSETICSIENLFFPWIITVTLPSGIFKTLKIFATVPVGWISFKEGDWTLESFCVLPIIKEPCSNLPVNSAVFKTFE